jgi:hypothetical protein
MPADAWVTSTGHSKAIAVVWPCCGFVQRCTDGMSLSMAGEGFSNRRIEAGVGGVARSFYEKHGFFPVRFGISPPPESEPDVLSRWKPD